MTWSRTVCGSLIQCNIVEARHRSDRPSPAVSASVFNFCGILLVHNFLSRAPKPDQNNNSCPNVRTVENPLFYIVLKRHIASGL